MHISTLITRSTTMPVLTLDREHGSPSATTARQQTRRQCLDHPSQSHDGSLDLPSRNVERVALLVVTPEGENHPDRKYFDKS